MITNNIAATGEENTPAEISVIASAGEANGIMIMTTSNGNVTMVEVSNSRAREMIAALQAGIDYFAELQDI